MTSHIEFERFLSYWKDHRGASADTIKAYSSDLKLFKSFLDRAAVTHPSMIDHQVIHDYMGYMRTQAPNRSGGLGLSAATIARRLAAVSSFMEFQRAVVDSNIRNPLSDFKTRWQRNNKPKPADEDDLAKLLKVVTSQRDKALFELLLSTGLRLSEMASLTRDSIKPQQIREGVDGEVREFVIGVGEVIGKGGKERTFFVDLSALRTWFLYLESRKDDHPALFLSNRRVPLSERTMQHTLQQWCKKAGIKHLRVHQLRHTYATRLVNAGIPIHHLRELLGHSSLNTTQNYAKIADTTTARSYHAAMEWLR